MKRIPSLDGLRAISIALVILGHLALRGGSSSIWLNYPNTGVRMFFVISGYLITRLLLREQSETGQISLRDFYVRRAFRILPAAVVFMTIAVASHWHALRWYQITTAFLFLANFILVGQGWVLWHLWSLSVEEQFYFLWPATLKRFGRHKLKILLGVIALAPIYQACLYYLKVHNGGYGTLPSVANNLAAGCLAAIVGHKLVRISKPLAVVMLSLVILIPLFQGTSPAQTLVALFILQPILHFSMAGLLLHVIQQPYRVLNSAPVVWIGHLSYSLYLWQQLFCNSPYSHSAFGVVPTIACACLSYYFVEQPMLRLREKRSLAPRAKEVASLAPSATAA